MTLSLIADVAGLLGLSMQIIEKIKKKFGKEESEILGLLLALSEKSKAVKKIHAKYHALYHSFADLNNYLKDPNNSVKYRLPSNINRDMLLQKIGESNIVDACYNLEGYLKSEIKDLQITVNEDVQEKISAVSRIDGKMAAYIGKIISHQGDIVKLHEEYINLFKGFKPLVYQSELSENDTAWIIGQRPYFTIHYNNIIYHTDEILMNYLDLYNQTLEYIWNI